MRVLAGSRRTAIWVAALAAVLVLAVTALAGARGPSASSSEAHATVTVKDLAFHPFRLTVARGTEITFANRDSVTHTATRRGSFDTGRIRPGKSASVRFGSRGTFRYACKIHSSMRGKIVVN